MTTDVTDQIICVLEYPEDGDQASVVFVNNTTLQADPLPDAKQYAKLVTKALRKDSQKACSGSATFGVTYGNTAAEKHVVTLPCLVSDQITIYFE